MEVLHGKFMWGIIKYFTDRSKAVLLLWIFLCFFLSCVCYAFMLVCLYVPCVHLLGKDVTSWLSFVVSNCEFCHFPIGILGQVWYLIVSISDLCTLLTLFKAGCINCIMFLIGVYCTISFWYHSKSECLCLTHMQMAKVGHTIAFVNSTKIIPYVDPKGGGWGPNPDPWKLTSGYYFIILYRFA